MLAGEGLGGVFQAILAIAGVDGTSEFYYSFLFLFLILTLSTEFGTIVGCPGLEFCG